MEKQFRLIKIGDQEDLTLKENILKVHLSPVEIHNNEYSFSESEFEVFLFLNEKSRINFFTNEPEEIKYLEMEEFEQGNMILPDGATKTVYKHKAYLDHFRYIKSLNPASANYIIRKGKAIMFKFSDYQFAHFKMDHSISNIHEFKPTEIKTEKKDFFLVLGNKLAVIGYQMENGFFPWLEVNITKTTFDKFGNLEIAEGVSKHKMDNENRVKIEVEGKANNYLSPSLDYMVVTVFGVTQFDCPISRQWVLNNGVALGETSF